MSEKVRISRRAFLKSTAAVGIGGVAFGSVRGIISAAPKKAGEKVWKMKYDCYIMNTAPTAQLDNWMLDRVVEKSKGQIKVEKYWASSLHKVGEHLQAVRDGMSEISMISYGYYPALVPLSRGLEWYYKGCDHSDTLLKVCRDMGLGRVIFDFLLSLRFQHVQAHDRGKEDQDGEQLSYAHIRFWH